MEAINWSSIFNSSQHLLWHEIWLFLWFHLEPSHSLEWPGWNQVQCMTVRMWLTDTSQIMTVPSFAPVASLEPLWENLRNQTYNKTTKDNYMYYNFNQSCVLKCIPLFQHLPIPWDAQGGKNSLNYLKYMIYTLGNIGPLIKRFELHNVELSPLPWCFALQKEMTLYSTAQN